MSGRFDAIIVGGGHNGLVAAAYLAKEGMRVLVVERRSVLGGACVTEEVWPGFRINRLAYAFGLFREEIINDLQLRKWGLELKLHDPFSFVPFPDGKHLFIWNDAAKTAKEIKRFSERDAKAYVEYDKFWNEAAKLFESLMLMPPPQPSDLEGLMELNIIDLIKFKLKPKPLLANLKGLLRQAEALRRLMFYSAKDLLDEYFESDYVKAALATQGVIGTMAGPMTPGTAYVLGHHVMGKVNGQRGAWAHVKGGMGSLIEALSKAARSYGAQILTNAGVSKVLVKEGRAVGVELEDGRRLEARVIVSNADPKQTLLRLVGEEYLEGEFVRRLKSLKDEGCVVKVNAAIKELPDYLAYPGKGPGPQHQGTTDIAPSIEYLERAYDSAKYGRMSEEPFLEVAFHSVTDPSLAPPGYHTLSIFAQYFPYSLRMGSWDELREEAGRRVVDTLAQYAPNVKDAITHMEVLTPLDMERTFSLPKGNIFHIEITPAQMFSFRPLIGWAQYRTPVKGLYLCGSGAHPGGGVSGAPGYNAARIVIGDIRAGSL